MAYIAMIAQGRLPRKRHLLFEKKAFSSQHSAFSPGPG
jgi:hypothetical protein